MENTIIMMGSNSIALSVGGFGNIVILISCVLQWIREGFSPFILIAVNMCLNNCLLICFQILNGLISILAYLQPMASSFQGILLVFLCNSLWSSSSLSLYYQFKIVPSSSTVNIWVKRNFPVLLPCFILFSLLLSMVIGVSSMFNDPDNVPSNFLNISIGKRNHTTSNLSLQVLMYCTFATLSILITYTSLMMILSSLRIHVLNMKKNADVALKKNIGAYYTVAKSITSLLVFNLFLFLSQIVGYPRGQPSWLPTLKTIALSVLLTMCPFILIAGNKKLRTEVKRTLECVLNILGIKIR